MPLPASFRLVGFDITNTTMLYLTQHTSDCNGGPASRISYVITLSAYCGIVTLYLHRITGDKTLYICVKDSNVSAMDYVHQGTDDWLSFRVQDDGESDGYYMPLFVQISVCVLLLVLSGLFSGLNLGLLSLDQTELKIISNAGSEQEKNWAKRIAPLRKRGNLLLCTMLLGNVIVNSTFTILFDNMTDGLIALISSTVGIVVFGEIVPQAICSRHGLAVGANTYWLTVLFMILTFPASYPISLILDKILGEEMGQVYNKDKLQELIKMTADSRVLQDNEADIMSGALQLTSKSVKDIMTKVSDVFMLDINRTLDFETMSEIMQHGFTRVPVYDEDSNISYLLNTKDLALIDPDDNIPLSVVCKFYDRRPLYVDHDLKLDAMLQEFLIGDSHMAIVQKLHNKCDHDPYYETVGLVTLEDVLEEILQREIIDEKDAPIDDRFKLTRLRSKPEYRILGAEQQRSTLPRQLAFVAFQFLSTTVEPFSEANLSKHVLQNLMKKDIVINLTPTDPPSQKNYIYQKGVPTDRFVLILQGTVEVVTGEENMVFESGPFSFFGVDALDLVRKQSSLNIVKAKDYVPDFSVRAITNVQYLCIDRSLYLVALRTTKMLSNTGAMSVKETFDAEMEKMDRMKGPFSLGFVSPKSARLIKNNDSDMKSSSSFNISVGHTLFAHPMTHSPISYHKSSSCQEASGDDDYKIFLANNGIIQISPASKPINQGDSSNTKTNQPIDITNYLPHSLPAPAPNKSILDVDLYKDISWKIEADRDEEACVVSPPHHSILPQPSSPTEHSFIITETNCDNETRILEEIPLINLTSPPMTISSMSPPQGSGSVSAQRSADDHSDRVPLLGEKAHEIYRVID
ncbi:Metal transporter cnnm4 [Bulinus truncatus]|nr:Metal transporter cnnm4 [Bulinus truncatus]